MATKRKAKAEGGFSAGEGFQVRDLALARYGLMARTVLEHWGIHSTDDLGEIVFAMVDCGVLIKREEDRLEDFRGLYDFEEVFERDYPWAGRR